MAEEDDRLFQIWTRIRATTPGTWEMGGWDRDEIYSDFLRVGPVLLEADWGEKSEYGTMRDIPPPHPAHDQAVANGVFIASAREDIFWLMNRHDDLERENALLRQILSEARGFFENVRDVLQTPEEMRGEG